MNIPRYISAGEKFPKITYSSWKLLCNLVPFHKNKSHNLLSHQRIRIES